jgi:ubiquinone/menaquinone biosynthesis C-methylase UbiE
MPIDFHAPTNRRTYSGRAADETWRAMIRTLAEPVGARVVDVGCGGGTYTRAWHELGAATVTGVDFSAPILDSAREEHGDLPGVRFHAGTATDTGLEAQTADVVWQRALVHHVPDLAAVAAEAWRVLRPGGVYLIQDRTMTDVSQPGAVTHPRGWFFETFPRLLDVERGRRPDVEKLSRLLSGHGFVDVSSRQLWETRRRYPDREIYLAEIRARTGRSILHELTDAELERLVARLRQLLPHGPVEERDRWTLWLARRPR